MAFLDAFARPRRREPMDERLPDGRTVDELIAAQIARPQVLTPQNQETITRPRQVNPPMEQPVAAPTVTNGFKGAFTRDRRTQPRDVVADDAAYYRDLQKQPRTWRDKLVDVIDAVNAGIGGPKRVVLSKRERELQRAGGQLEADLEMQKQELNQMVPVTLDNGTQVMVPHRTAGSMQSRQQEIKQRGQRIGELGRSDALSRYNRLTSYKHGENVALDDYFDEIFGGPPPDKNPAERFELKWSNGQLYRVPVSGGGAVAVPSMPTDQTQVPTVVPGPQGNVMVKPATAATITASNTRAANAQREQNYRAGLRGTATKVGGRTPAPDRATNRRAAVLIGQIDRARGEMEAADTAGDPKRKEQARLLGEQAASELHALGAGYEAGRGEGGYPYYKKAADDPKIRAYANQFFGGDYGAAMRAIEAQRNRK